VPYAARPMGDYKTYGYGGDPGFLSSLWKGVKTVAGGIIGGMIAGPAGAAIGAGVGAGKKQQQPFQLPGTVGGAVSFPGGTQVGIGFLPQGRLPPYTASGPGVLAGGGQLPRGALPMVNGTCVVGYHPVKTGAGYCVRNRRMNTANPRALRRGMRRVAGFEKLARRTIAFTRRVKIKKRSST